MSGATVSSAILSAVAEWEERLLGLPADIQTGRRNEQGRSVKQIVGHLVDSATNNTHRIIHLQHRDSPLEFPNYATNGNNDRWIAIQNYQDEDWTTLIQLWKYTNIHLAHVIQNMNDDRLDALWVSGPNECVSLREMVTDYPQHMLWHLEEVGTLIG